MWVVIRSLLVASITVAGAVAGSLGCASGGSGTGDDQPARDASVQLDGSPSMMVDAPGSTPDAPLADASVMVDAAAPAVDAAMPDAPPSLFCTANNQCVTGECCLTLGQPQGFCAPGTIVFDECFPITP